MLDFKALLFYEREIWLKNLFDALFKPVMGKIYDTKAPGYRGNDKNEEDSIIMDHDEEAQGEITYEDNDEQHEWIN